MCSSCLINYYSSPFDYQISTGAYQKLFENRDMQHFEITIEEVTYDFKLKQSPDTGMNYIVKTVKDGKKSSNIIDSFSLDDISEIYDYENDGIKNNNDSLKSNISLSEKRELLRRLFLGKSIMIDDLNISFLHQAAKAIGIPELSQIKDLTDENCAKQSNQFIFYYKKNIFYIKHSIKSFFFHLWTSIFNLFCFFGYFGRVLHTMWDLAGPTMIICLFLNILILFITMALVTLKHYLVWFFIVVIPLLLYSLYFPNIMCIPLIEALERNIYLKKTFFYSHQKLISIFIKIIFDVDSIPKYFHLGKLHSFIHGVLITIFMCGFLANLMNEKAPRFLNVWLIIFVFYVPLIRYFTLYIFYLVHSIVSLFNGPRRRYLEIGDFEDPFLCSFYLNERSWIDFFLTKSKKEKLAHKGRLIIRFIFSKTTFSLLATLAVIIYMCCAETRMTAKQVCITIFIGICMIFFLSTRISFPFFWLRRMRDRKLTEGKIEEMRENIKFVAYKRALRYKLATDTENEIDENENEVNDDFNLDNEDEEEDIQDKIDDVDYKIKEMLIRQEALKWHKKATTWSKNYKYLRWTSLILVCLTFIFIVVLISLSGATAVGTSKDKFVYQQNITTNRPLENTTKVNRNGFENYDLDILAYLNATSKYPLSPICYLKPKGLSITEIIALSFLSDPPSPGNFTEFEWYIVDEFLADRGEVGKDIIFMNTPFKWDKSFPSSMTLTRFRKEPKLSVFAIRGTDNEQDMIADVEIWFASCVINVMNAFFPFVDLYSEKTIEYIGIVTNLPRYAFKQFSLVEEYKNRFVDFIYEYIYGQNETKNEMNNDEKPLKKSFFERSKRHLKKKLNKNDLKLDFHIDPDEDVMIIGHSLGGGLAKIISLVTGIQAVALSGPGVRFIGHFYHNKTVKNVKETIVDIIPDQDLVARVDMPLGTQIQVPCRRGLNCHDTFRLICQISVMCNTYIKHHNFCEMMFDNETIDEMFRIGEVMTKE